MSAKKQGNTLGVSPILSEDEFIPHMIYMLSFLLNVGNQYTGGTIDIEAEREKLKSALIKRYPGRFTADAAEIDINFKDARIPEVSKTIDGLFTSSISYGKPGCPASIDTLVTLAQQGHA